MGSLDDKIQEIESFIEKVNHFLNGSVPDRRRAARQALVLNIQFRTFSQTGIPENYKKAMLLNISKVGMLLHTNINIPVDTKIETVIAQPKDGKKLRSMGQITRQKKLADGIYSAGIEIHKILP